MCDTLLARGIISEKRNLIFAKNSDREPLEAQEQVHIPRISHSEKTLNCTYIQITQVSSTWEVWLSKPFQMWGAEMGVNEWGLAIGNEAVFTQVKFDKSQPGLTGMDLLRLALERSKTAMAAKDLIIELLEKFGQNACGGYENKNFYYHNSFLIADPKDALILETAGKSWAWKRVKNHASISNCLSLEDDFEEWGIKEEDMYLSSIFNSKKGFKSRYSDFLYTYFSKAKDRKSYTEKSLISQRGQTGPKQMMEILKSHHPIGEGFHPKKASAASVCMHATGLTNPSETTGSMVAEIRKDQPHTIWLCPSPHPCQSLYIPFYFGNETSFLTHPSHLEDDSLWWQAKKLHTIIERNWKELFPKLKAELNQIQENWIKRDNSLIEEAASPEELSKFSLDCYLFYQKWIKEKLQEVSK